MNPAATYILNQPEPYRSILLELQALIEHMLPEMDLRFKYKIPFYYYKNRPFCYFNASHKKQYVDLGFCQGQKISVCLDYLVTEKRKKMASLRYTSLEDINVEVLREILDNVKTVY